MMKSFFKKLAFVMALAMVVSMVAPAGSAFAATTGVAYQASKEVVTTYEFAKAGDTVDFCFLGAPSDWKSTFKWETSDPAVATVDKAGIVTAVAAGTATITITAGADASYKETVVVTVPSALDFEIAQVDTVTATLTFNAGADLSAVSVDDFEVTAIDEMFEYTLFANTVAVKDNVVTLTFIEGVLSDGAVIKVGYQGVEKTLVASNGEVAKVAVAYGMNNNYTGDAYVYTDLDPDYVLLGYKLYDANGIDVTANFEENVDYAIEWTLTAGEDIASEPEEGEKGWQMSFDEKGAATVKATVIFPTEEGDERPVESAATTIVAKNRPAIGFSFEKAGITTHMTDWDVANKKASVESFASYWGSLWNDPAYSSKIGSSIQKGTGAWFAAKLTDNRGRGLISTQLTFDYDKADSLYATGTTAYGENGKYGYFVYESSNEDVLAVDVDGYVTGVEVGTATILVSFVKLNEDGEAMKPVKVASKRITVTTDFPEPYAKSFEFIKDSLTLTSTGPAASVNGTMYLRIYDQYGRAMNAFTAAQLNTASTVSSINYPKAADLFTFKAAENNKYTGYDWAYPVSFSGETLSKVEKVKITDNNYANFKFTVEFDKELDAFAKLTTKNDKASVKVYNVDKYYGELTKFFSKETPAAFYDEKEKKTVDTAYKNWNWTASGSKNIDVYADKRTEFGSGEADEVISVEVKVALNSSAGLKLMDLPETHFIDLGDAKVDKINNIKKAEDRGLIEGAIYYQISVPSKVNKDAFYVVPDADDAKLTFVFNAIETKDGVDYVIPATEGAYTVTMYYVNNQNKLMKLTNGTQTINVKNSAPAVKAEGFKSGNVYEGTIASEEDAMEVLKTMYNFSWNGELMYDETRWYTESPNFEILSVVLEDIEEGDTKVVVKEITFKTGYFNNCKADGAGSVTNNADDLYQTYTLKKRITIRLAQ